MPKKPGVKASPAVSTALQPVAARLNRIEDLLIEMRGTLDVHLKRLSSLQAQVDMLIEKARHR